MERPVEVAVFDRGELQSVRVLSPGRERWAAVLAAATGATLVLGAMAWRRRVARGVPLCGARAHLLPVLAGCRRRRRIRIRALGPGPAAQLPAGRGHRGRRVRDGRGRTASPRRRRLRAGAGARACPAPSSTSTPACRSRRSSAPARCTCRCPRRARCGSRSVPCTFVISRRTAPAGRPFPLAEWLSWVAAGPIRRVARAAALGTPIAALATLMGSVQMANAMTEVEERFAIPADATPGRGRAADPGQGAVPVRRAARLLRSAAAGLPAGRLRGRGPVAVQGWRRAVALGVPLDLRRRVPGHQLHGGRRGRLAVRADAGADERRHPGPGEAHAARRWAPPRQRHLPRPRRASTPARAARTRSSSRVPDRP